MLGKVQLHPSLPFLFQLLMFSSFSFAIFSTPTPFFLFPILSLKLSFFS